MIRRISFRLAINALLALLTCLAIFHILVLVGLVPFEMVWGGRLDDPSSLRLFELVSLLITLLMLLIVAIRAGLIRLHIPGFIIHSALWIMTAYFLFNTFSNLLSLNSLEALIFTPVSVLATVFCYRIACG